MYPALLWMSYMGKMKTIVFIFVIIQALLISFLPATNAGECDYGTLYAWYSEDGSSWENATVHDAKLKRGEPFYIKTMISTKINSVWIAMKLSETGENSADESSFEVLDGPCDMYEMIDLGEIPEKNTSLTYTWKMRVKPDTNWAGGNAPLNIGVFFDKKVNDDWYSDDISFTAVNVYILDELWEGYTEDNGDSNDSSNGTNGTPGFELLFTLIAIAVFLTWKRKNE